VIRAFYTKVLLSQIIRQEPLISENRRPALRALVERLLQKMQETQHHSFTLFKAGARDPTPAVAGRCAEPGMGA
jgi:hypothetical protein